MKGAKTKTMNDLSSHGVVAVIVQDDRYLLLEDSRELMHEHWSAPHGRCIESDQNEEETVVREVAEETGLEVIPIRKIWTTKADTKIKTVSFWLAEKNKGEVQLDPQESSDFGWFTLEEILKLKLYPGNRKFFTLIKNGELNL